jgi:hypothetical protein
MAGGKGGVNHHRRSIQQGNLKNATPRCEDMTVFDLTITDLSLQRLYHYWLAKKGERIAPRRADIAPEEITELLPWVFLVEIVGDRLRYRLVGSAIIDEYGGGLAGKYIDEVDLDHVTAQMVDEYHHAARAIAPLVSRWSFTKNNGRHLDYERLILPLSADRQTVNMYLCGAVGHGVG